MNKRMILILIGATVLVVFASYNSSFRHFVAQFFLPKPYKTYPHLQEVSIESHAYELMKVIDSRVHELALDKETGNIIISRRAYREINQEKKLWKLSTEGQLLDVMAVSWREQDYFYRSGIFFMDSGYVDWVHSGDTAIKPYVEVVRKESFPQAELRTYLEEARRLECVNDYDGKKGRCYLETGNGWTVLESAELYEDYYGNYTSAYYGEMIREYKEQQAPYLDEMVSSMEEEERLLKRQYFVEKTRQSKSFYDINDATRGGWNGTGYFQLDYRSEVFHFKAYTFKSGGILSNRYSSDISIYTLPKVYEADILIMHVRKPPKSKRDYGEEGLYVVRKKTGE